MDPITIIIVGAVAAWLLARSQGIGQGSAATATPEAAEEVVSLDAALATELPATGIEVLAEADPTGITELILKLAQLAGAARATQQQVFSKAIWPMMKPSEQVVWLQQRHDFTSQPFNPFSALPMNQTEANMTAKYQKLSSSQIRTMLEDRVTFKWWLPKPPTAARLAAEINLRRGVPILERL